MESDIRKSASYLNFNKRIFDFIRPRSNDVFNVSHPKGPIFLTSLHVALCQLRERKFKHSFNKFKLHCTRFTNERQKILLKIKRIIPDILRKTDTSITSILQYGDPSFSAELNTNILSLSVEYTLSTWFESLQILDW